MTKQHLSTLLLLLVSWKAIVVDQSANVIDGAKLSSRNYIHLTDRRQTYLWVQQNLFKKVFLFFLYLLNVALEHLIWYTIRTYIMPKIFQKFYQVRKESCWFYILC